MADATEQLTFDQTLFHPDAAMRAMRDSRYRHEANAIAELIDNSIDARASRVELILLEEQKRAKTRSARAIPRPAAGRRDGSRGPRPRSRGAGGRSGSGRSARGPAVRSGPADLDEARAP